MYPVIDPRNLKQIITQMQDMVPGYTPDWNFSPEAPDAGTALFLLFADMLQSNIKRLNRMPHKQFIAFLNMLGVSMHPPVPAGGYAVFELAAGAKGTVPLPEGTPLASVTSEGEEVPFETSEPIRLSPVSLVDLVQVSPHPDRIVRCSGPFCRTPEGEEPEPIRLFDPSGGSNLQEHALYLAHPEVLELRHAARIELQIDHSAEPFRIREFASLLSDKDLFTWSYRSGGVWLPFEEVNAAERGILLVKRGDIPLDESAVEGQTSRWIRCRLNDGVKLSHHAEREGLTMQPDQIVLDGIRIRSSHPARPGYQGFRPDMLFWNDVQIDAEQGGYAFGKRLAPYSVFYIGSREAFSKKGAVVRLSFRQTPVRTEPIPVPVPPTQWKLIMKPSDFPPSPPEPPELYVERVLWEYWNGTAWMRLMKGSEAETIFRTTVETCSVLEFVCPPDMEETFVNAQPNYWIRARVISSEHDYAAQPAYIAPYVDRLGLVYDYAQSAQALQGCLSFNNAAVVDRLHQASEPGRPFRPFAALEAPSPCAYFGFDLPLEQGPLSLLLHIRPQPDQQGAPLRIEWEYASVTFRGTEWKKLKAIDRTEGFRRTGTLQFTGPEDLAAVTCFGRTLYWIRAVQRSVPEDYAADSLPVLLGVYMNGVRIAQQESHENEMPERIPPDVQEWLDGTGPRFRLTAPPVLQENVWVDETGSVPEEELSRLKSGDPATVQIQQDSSGRLHRVWIRWQRVPDLRNSAEGERHYMLDPHTGVLTFGNGVHGRRLPHEGPEILKVSYKTGGGAKGNVDAYRINKLKRSIAFVSGVFNPEPAGGGGDSETVEDAMLRGPQLLKHRQRAVSPGDFEWLAREACPEIVRVKCLPNTDAGMQTAPGQVTLIVLTRGALQDAGRFPEYRRRIESYLMQCAPAPLAAAGRIRAVPPVFLAVSVTAELTVRDPADLLHTEEQAALELERFLDPVHGSPDGAGWGFGEPIHPSVFYGVLRSVPGVANVSALRITVSRWVNRQLQAVDLETASSLPNGIRCSGTHRLRITL